MDNSNNNSLHAKFVKGLNDEEKIIISNNISWIVHTILISAIFQIIIFNGYTLLSFVISFMVFILYYLNYSNPHSTIPVNKDRVNKCRALCKIIVLLCAIDFLITYIPFNLCFYDLFTMDDPYAKRFAYFTIY